jgi:hypothetical protein
MNNSELHNQIVRRVIETKAIDFGAVGKVISEFGAAAALSDDDDLFCLTGPHMIRFLRPTGAANTVETLPALRALATELAE